ncbi:hypothetical protein HP499_07225 [Paenarthrobacter sp. CM16]|uniref:hypothetical protein n=1 Tax=Paenarthrobacter sp. CM16 TaxID=2738447 RepID=UPI001553F588|nr:hypothetical protein [Paenarthrobacter sp. CM16]NQD87595.1 hypothetical protein [Paenarthrobacter sp. CM16]
MRHIFAVSLAGLALASGCALGSNAPGRAAAAVKDGARRETLPHAASEGFTEYLYGPASDPPGGGPSVTGMVGAFSDDDRFR